MFEESLLKNVLLLSHQELVYTYLPRDFPADRAVENLDGQIPAVVEAPELRLCDGPLRESACLRWGLVARLGVSAVELRGRCGGGRLLT